MYSQDLFESGDQFVNDGATAVTDSLLGLACIHSNIGLFDFGNVIVRRDYAAIEGFKIISGGGSGHEPSHAGFVGKGMLAAAIQGDVFRSPTMTDILKTLRELSYGQDFGILLIIQNNMSDRLNFGLAAERAHSQGILVKTLVVSEEYCVTNPYQGRRGLSGIVLLNKIAGAMAETGQALNDVFAFCQKVHESMSSMLISLKYCTPPTLKQCFCNRNVNKNEIEISSGLHGEIGSKRVDKTTVREICKMIIDDFASSMFKLDSATSVVVLINNLGNMLQMEEMIFVKEFVSCLRQMEVSIARVYHGQFLTALDMRGFTVTVLKVFDPKVLDHLDAPCETVAWGGNTPKQVSMNFEERIPARIKERKYRMTSGVRISEQEGNVVLLAVQFACDALISCEKQINTFDSEFGSGNVGSKMKQGALTVLYEMKNKTLRFIYPKVFFETLSNIAEKEICSTIGILYSILFEAASNSFREVPENSEVTPIVWSKCFNDAVQAIKSYTSASYGAGTMFDPLYAASVTIEESLQQDLDGLHAFGLGVSAAEKNVPADETNCKKVSGSGCHYCECMDESYVRRNQIKMWKLNFKSF